MCLYCTGKVTEAQLAEVTWLKVRWLVGGRVGIEPDLSDFIV